MESGSTIILTFISNNVIICANYGDSRAILITEKESRIIPLSKDHKPELPEEKIEFWKVEEGLIKFVGWGF